MCGSYNGGDLFLFKQKTAYEMRISDWSSDVCSSDLTLLATAAVGLWLLAAPAVLGTSGAAADSDHLVGALIVTITAVALAEPTRAFQIGRASRRDRVCQFV